MRKQIAFDENTFARLSRPGRDRIATIQELANEAFAGVLRKHGIRSISGPAVGSSPSPTTAAAVKGTSNRSGKAAGAT
ncbi:hypothetical protein FFI89_021335 [Bradyrhizobium sp. KBS0727]|jgi:hypothetical protein|uniref:hypothetical protein n=1 Tax=unclassified Bradyrhizobium TaxID=2631580 RepID=UPI00110E4C53|nr:MULTISPECIES: hypothetical protein [unclassified Bradyrhizobium]QDW39457.1 hypothetical protein FFI71_021340 [Bradyrhizobium sp. KBS0725]QDW46060.1 hypothetical protein FFI89_021335 [Bradyrhizobium sp. KBS0727]